MLRLLRCLLQALQGLLGELHLQLRKTDPCERNASVATGCRTDLSCSSQFAPDNSLTLAFPTFRKLAIRELDHANVRAAKFQFSVGRNADSGVLQSMGASLTLQLALQSCASSAQFEYGVVVFVHVVTSNPHLVLLCQFPHRRLGVLDTFFLLLLSDRSKQT